MDHAMVGKRSARKLAVLAADACQSAAYGSLFVVVEFSHTLRLELTSVYFCPPTFCATVLRSYISYISRLYF